ncbi:FAD monooxygenase [Pseudovirgaria hyperparasitica]|uniref:FAD monooxygenase n=1 Tax=Pseudovirgaria hyperparasitica TaxID=470096 RepID=A0A6A6W9I3_9PEZI|nr:FAD monooxygenase [Pseudovirgaria hyperparasitica]KAF2759538.1 FAD monooxygenase [Pseudovirgaria hyperparasitica]
MTRTTTETVDIVIVGGGPTGLLSAFLARQLGLSIAVLDSKDSTLTVGRADALNARSQQYLEVAGVLEELLPKGIRCNTSTIFADGEFKSRQSHWWNSLTHCFHNNFLMVGQPVVEAVLASHLDFPIHFSEPAVSFSESDEGVTVRTAKRTVQAKYLIASDGARSAVRTALEIPFEGTKPNMTWAVLDTFIDTDFPVCSEIITFQLDGQSRISWIPRERGMARFYVLHDDEITQEKTEASIRKHMAPYRIDFVETEWFSKFEIKERIAETFVSKCSTGRIILAGDAAHVHSVNGGQGLNTGIADAFSLIWRLKMCLSPSTSPTAKARILQSYNTERHSVAQEVIDIAAKLVRKTITEAKDYVAVIEKNAGYITGMGVNYAGIGSAMIKDSETGLFKAGNRMPDLWVKTAGKDHERLYSKFSYGHFVMVRIGGGKGVEVPSEVEVVTVGPSKEPGESALSASWVRQEDRYVVVVRPDMYVGYVGSEREGLEYLRALY